MHLPCCGPLPFGATPHFIRQHAHGRGNCRVTNPGLPCLSARMWRYKRSSRDHLLPPSPTPAPTPRPCLPRSYGGGAVGVCIAHIDAGSEKPGPLCRGSDDGPRPLNAAPVRDPVRQMMPHPSNRTIRSLTLTLSRSPITHHPSPHHPSRRIAAGSQHALPALAGPWPPGKSVSGNSIAWPRE
jgi:hypothetical protein